MGERNRSTRSEWMRYNGDSDTKGNRNLSGLGVLSGRYVVPERKRVNAESISHSRGTAHLLISNHSGEITTVAGSSPRRTFHTKVSTIPSSGVGQAKDGVTY